MSKLYDYYVDEYGRFIPYMDSSAYEPGAYRARTRRASSPSWDSVIEEVETITDEVLETFLEKARNAVHSPIAKEAAYHTGIFACKLALFMMIRSSQRNGIELNGHL